MELLDHVWVYCEGSIIGCGGAEGFGNVGAYGSGAQLSTGYDTVQFGVGDYMGAETEGFCCGGCEV